MEKKGRKEGLLERTAEVFDLPGDVVVENISMSESLYVLSYYMNRQEG